MSNKLIKALNDPRRAADTALHSARKKLLRTVVPIDGVRVMEEDWDNLILLDACRFDVFSDVNWIPGELSHRRTLGTNTAQFLERNFDGQEFYDTVYLSSNGAVGSYRKYIDVYKLIGVWADQEQELGWDKNRDVVHPEVLVQRALEAYEEYPNKRLIVHFLQPHCPYIVRDGELLEKGSMYRDLEAAARGEVTTTEMRSIYAENLEFVLECVDDLVDGIPGKTVISADHGELLGDPVPLLYKLLDTRWPLGESELYEYGHWADIRVPGLTNVPWLEVEKPQQRRRRIVEADDPEQMKFSDEVIEEQLEVLGYK